MLHESFFNRSKDFWLPRLDGFIRFAPASIDISINDGIVESPVSGLDRDIASSGFVPEKGGEALSSGNDHNDAGSRTTYHASRVRYHVSRVTDHLKRVFTVPGHRPSRTWPNVLIVVEIVQVSPNRPRSRLGFPKTPWWSPDTFRIDLDHFRTLPKVSMFDPPQGVILDTFSGGVTIKSSSLETTRVFFNRSK